MRRKSLTKESVLDAAGRIVREKGLSQCTIRMLSKDLHVAVGTLYNYYPSRDLLLLDLFQRSWHHTIIRLKVLSHNGDSSLQTRLKSGLKIIQEDVANRDGLGWEIGNRSNRILFTDIRRQIIESFSSLMDGWGEGDSKALEIRATWIYAVISDEIINYEKIDNETIETLIEGLFPR